MPLLKHSTYRNWGAGGLFVNGQSIEHLIVFIRAVSNLHIVQVGAKALIKSGLETNSLLWPVQRTHHYNIFPLMIPFCLLQALPSYFFLIEMFPWLTGCFCYPPGCNFPPHGSWYKGCTSEELSLIPWPFLYALVVTISKRGWAHETCRLALYTYIIKHIKPRIKSLYLETTPFSVLGLAGSH